MKIIAEERETVKPQEKMAKKPTLFYNYFFFPTIFSSLRIPLSPATMKIIAEERETDKLRETIGIFF